MLFNSLIFLVFLVCVFAGYWLIKPTWRNFFLLAASYYFYFSYNPWFLLLLIGTSGLDFFLAKCISKAHTPKKRKQLLVLSLISNLGILFVFKYAVFFYNTSFELFTGHDALIHQFIIPAGLSFYTFQSMSYTIDVYRRKYEATDTLPDFLLYVSFFPHMVAGPIVRHNSLMPQLKTRHYFKNIDWENSSKLIIWGFFKKMVIADNIAYLVDPVFNHIPDDFNSLEFIAIGFLFLVQLYADFSGYSDIALGVAKLFNIHLNLNWRRPLLSQSVTDYWKRHHISLTNWFKEYVYFSLGGNRVSVPKWIFNVLLVFLLSGLWHGANFTFIIWGVLNGLFYLLEHAIKIPLKFPPLFKWLYTMLLISIFFMAFRANTVHDLLLIYDRIFIHINYHKGFAHLLQFGDKLFFVMLLALLALLFLKELLEEHAVLKPSYLKRQVLTPVFYILVLFLIFSFGNFHANRFIYFQF